MEHSVNSLGEQSKCNQVILHLANLISFHPIFEYVPIFFILYHFTLSHIYLIFWKAISIKL